MSANHAPSPWRRPGRVIVLGLAALLLIALAAFHFSSGSGVKAEIEAIRKRGLPANAAELDGWYKAVPDAENAALLFMEAAKEHVEPAVRMNPNDQRDWKAGEPIPPDLAEMVALYVESNQTALEKLDAAAQLKASRYPIDLTMGFATLLPELAEVKKLAQLSKWAAIHRSAENKPTEAVQILKNGLALAASLEQEPILISELVRIACLKILVDALQQVVSQHPLEEAELAELSEAIRKAEEHGRTGIFRALVGERATGIAAFDLSYRELEKLSGGSGSAGGDPVSDSFKAVWYGVRRASGLHTRDRAFYLEIMGDWEQAAQKDYPGMLREAERTNGRMDEELTGQTVYKYSISSMILPALSRAMEKEAILVARLRCARMALAIERYRLKNGGRLPPLAELSPGFLDAIPTDPVNGEMLEYHLNAERGYRIQAVEATERANKGRASNNLDDIAFTVTR